jgi:hypothetical protein
MNTTKIKDLLNQKRDASLAEEVITFILESDLNENIATVDKYEITQHARDRNSGESQDITHVKANLGKLKGLKIPHPYKEDGFYGDAVRITVKNKETGDTSHHSVYQSGVDTHRSKKPIMSIRSIGAPRAVSAEHAEVIANHLGKKLKPFGQK